MTISIAWALYIAVACSVAGWVARREYEDDGTIIGASSYVTVIFFFVVIGWLLELGGFGG